MARDKDILHSFAHEDLRADEKSKWRVLFSYDRILHTFIFKIKAQMEIPRLKLKPQTKAILTEWLFIIVTVNVLMFGYYIIGWWGLMDYLTINTFDAYLNSYYIYLEIFIQSTLFGILFGLINYLADNTRIRKMSFGTVILVKTFFYLIAIALSQAAVFGVYHVFQIVQLEVMIEMQQKITKRFIISVFIFFIFLILLLNFLLHINRKFGPGILFSMITGKYYRPTQEKRIFMFLDMRNSTRMAESLGNYKYSLLIKDCIHVMSDLILRYRAQVYQYVGDEIVLTWPKQKGLKDQNFLNIYFAYLQRLDDKKEYFLKHYNTMPFFKAGIDEGLVTVTEVGDIKRELAYHGDALHTAARLEKMCNQLNQKVLITENLNSQIIDVADFNVDFLGDYLLKGKGRKDKVYGVERVR